MKAAILQFESGTGPAAGEEVNLSSPRALNQQRAMNTPAYAPERRPMPCRDWSLSGQAADWLIRQRISPNAISILGMSAAIVAGIALAATAFPGFHRAGFMVALLGLGIRALGNMLDGMVAVGSGRASAVGELYNEIPDRISDAALLVGLGFAAGSSPILGFTAALAAVFVAYVRAQGKACGAHHEFCGPMGKPARMLVVALVCAWAALAPLQWQALNGLSIPALALIVIIAGCMLTVVRRLNRIAAALRNNAPEAK